ncbi:MAG: ATP-binding protein [Candidatus Promineifilaceae bacterium]|nr:ATP-binding protein [Candidatus Promineifilaceae bacterium]
MALSDFFRKIPLFSQLDADDMKRLCSLAQEVQLAAGEELFAEGSLGERAYIVEDGQVEVLKVSNRREVKVATVERGEVVGELALLENRPRSATVRARTDALLWAIDKEQLLDLLRTSPSAAETMFFTVLDRWRHTESLLRQSEKMAQLGTLAAGVAHELNNPAAAVRRGAVQLEGAIVNMAQAFVRIIQSKLTAPQQATLERLTAHVRQQAAAPLHLDALARSDRENEVEAWLEAQGVPDAWEVAPTMVSLNLSDEDLEVLTEMFTGSGLRIIVTWLNANYDTFNLLAELRQGAGRIADIVMALKSYAYLDQAPVQQVDVHQGLDDTLLILRHKLATGIDVQRSYASDLPVIEGHGSDLNQVWTNLIDNAIDAVSGVPDGPVAEPTVTVSTRMEGDPEDRWVVVTIGDNGPGIPEEALPKLFDPFFTTKPPGKGTGLGLDISYNIVVHKHGGEIRVDSEPGRTTFEVWLPVNYESS